MLKQDGRKRPFFVFKILGVLVALRLSVDGGVCFVYRSKSILLERVLV